jgi:hypothetical protein
VLPINLQFILLSSFSEGRFLKIDQLETRIAYGSHVCLQMGRKSSPLKPLGQMNRSLVESIYGMSSIKIALFVPIR